MVFVLLCLATYRVTRFVIDDQLAQPVVSKIQGRFERRFDAKHPDRADPTKWQSQVGYLLSCPWCLSIYVGAIIIGLTCWLSYDVPRPVLVWLAASGVTGLLSTYEHRGN